MRIYQDLNAWKNQIHHLLRSWLNLIWLTATGLKPYRTVLQLTGSAGAESLFSLIFLE